MRTVLFFGIVTAILILGSVAANSFITAANDWQERTVNAIKESER